MRAHFHRHTDFPRPYSMPSVPTRQRSRFPAFLAGMLVGGVIGSFAVARIVAAQNDARPDPTREATPAVDFRESYPPLPEPAPEPLDEGLSV